MAGRLLLVGELSNELTELKIGFEATGLTVEMAPDGLAAIDKGKEFQPDLVVTEILTNRLSGFELALRIGSGEAGFSAPVIFYTEFYRDEKARREVLTKYQAMQYFVRPFQKEALKKSVSGHFQDFFSSLPVASVAASAPEPVSDAPEASPIVPELSRAAAAVERKPTNSISSRPISPGNPSGVAGEVPARFRSFSPAEQVPANEVGEAPPEVDNLLPEQPMAQPETQVEDRPTTAPPKPHPVPASAKNSQADSRVRLLPVAEPSGVGRALQSTPLRIAAVLVVGALVFYFVRGQFRSGSEQRSTQPVPAAPIVQSPATPTTPEPTAQPASPPSTVASSTPPVQQPSPTSQVATEPVVPASPGPEPQSTGKQTGSKGRSGKKNDNAESGTAAVERSSAVSIQDVTGSGRGPVLRKMKPIQLSQDVVSSLTAKAVVVRVVIDNTGKVTEVTPLNQEGGAASLPAGAIDTIQQWEFSRSRRKDAGDTVKYFSLKVPNSP